MNKRKVTARTAVAAATTPPTLELLLDITQTGIRFTSFHLQRLDLLVNTRDQRVILLQHPRRTIMHRCRRNGPVITLHRDRAHHHVHVIVECVDGSTCGSAKAANLIKEPVGEVDHLLEVADQCVTVAERGILHGHGQVLQRQFRQA